MTPGPLNLITDVSGIRVGQSRDLRVRTGVSLVMCDRPAVGAVDVRGGAPGTRETDLLKSGMAGFQVDGVILSGGSALGLDAGSAVAAALSARGCGLKLVPDMPAVPLLPGAILFDLTNGGDKAWGDNPPYRRLGLEALENLGRPLELGTHGAGTGARAGRLQGGLGSASVRLPDGVTVGALVAVNSVGSVLVPGTSIFWAAPYAYGDELGPQKPIPPGAAGLEFPDDCKMAARLGGNTTIAVIAVDAVLGRDEAERVAIMAQDGIARAMRPAHTPMDGDSVFVLATGAKALAGERHSAIARLGSSAADCLARAIARGVYEATTLGETLCYRDMFRL